MPTTRFPNGVTNAGPQATLGAFGAPDPTKYHCYMNDFDTFAAGDWTITGVGTPTEALTSGDGGLLLLTNTAAATDSVFLDKVGASFLMEAGKPAWFRTRFSVSDATQSIVVAGLQITDTTPADATDGIYFIKQDGVATVDFVCRQNGTTGSTMDAAVATLVSATFITLGWYYDGQGTVQAFANDAMVGSLATAGFLPDTTLTVSFGIQNGEAVAKTMTMDYIFAAKAR